MKNVKFLMVRKRYEDIVKRYMFIIKNLNNFFFYGSLIGR